MSRLCLNFCCFEGDGLLATKTCLACEHDKIRHLEIVDVLIHAYGLLVGGQGSSCFRMMAGLRRMEGSRQQSGHSCWGLSETLGTAVGLNPMEMSEKTGFVTAAKKNLKGNINLQAVVVGTSSAVCFCFSRDYEAAHANKGT